MTANSNSGVPIAGALRCAANCSAQVMMHANLVLHAARLVGCDPARRLLADVQSIIHANRP